MTLSRQAKLDIERVLILHRYCRSSIAGILGAAIVIGFVAYSHLSPLLFWIWLAGTLSAIPIRTWLRHRLSLLIKTSSLSLEEAQRWERNGILSSLLPSLSILSATFFPYQDNQLIIFLYIALLMIAMVSGSIISSVTSIKTSMLFMNTTVPPFILACLIKQDSHFFALAILVTIFYFAFFILSLKINQTVIQAIKLQIDQQEMAYRDSLTNLWNRRKLFNVIEDLDQKNFSVLLADVDNFKELNDKYGHSKGDEVLIQISESIKRSVGEDELVVRYGGEEFLIIVFDDCIQNAATIAERIRTNTKNDCDLTVSIGICLLYTSPSPRDS